MRTWLRILGFHSQIVGRERRERENMRARLIAFLFFLCFVFSDASAQGTANSSVYRSSLDGRWDVAFDILEQQYRTFMELGVSRIGALL